VASRSIYSLINPTRITSWCIIDSREGVEVKRLVTVVTLAILLVGLILFDLTDLNISVADTSIPDNKIASSQTKARNSCAVATIMGARTTPSGEGGSNG
jgi:hypothetical protein